jgi:ABC-type transporter Mla maintaining outer membrane lipid asymmetry permease subunit MlaE
MTAQELRTLATIGLQSTWLGRRLAALGNDSGALDARIGAIIGGVITLVIGMVLASTVNTQAASTGAAANIGSFTGAQALNDLIPLVYIAAIVMVGVGLIGMGGAGYMGVGPMGRR